MRLQSAHFLRKLPKCLLGSGGRGLSLGGLTRGVFARQRYPLTHPSGRVRHQVRVLRLRLGRRLGLGLRLAGHGYVPRLRSAAAPRSLPVSVTSHRC